MSGEWTTVSDARRAWAQEPSTVAPDAPLSAAAEAILARPHGRNVYVVDGSGLLVGVVSFRTLLKAAESRLAGPTGGVAFIGAWRELLADLVRDVMRKPISVRPDTPLVDALALLRRHHQTDLPIVDEGDRLVAELNGLQVMELALQVLKGSESRVRRAQDPT